MFDLHRHDEYSTFDGFGNAVELARLAKHYGYKSLCTTNHGNTNGLIQTYQACKNEGLKAILGVEGYCLPRYKEQTRGFHLVLIAKNLKGYENLNRIQYEGDKQRYFNPIWTLDLLREYREGLICTTACVASYSSQAIIRGKTKQAERFISELESIFGDDLYVEIQPYRISDPGVQEKVNKALIELSLKHGWKMILTSDSHRGAKDDMPTYLKMHEVAGHSLEHIEETYAERYMPAPDEMRKRFIKMHRADFSLTKCVNLAKEMYDNLDEIEDKCEADYLDSLPLSLPSFGEDGEDSTRTLRRAVRDGLRRRGKDTKEYRSRCKEELEVIEFHGFTDYFLMVADYANWAKEQGIVVGPGRGSVCNSLVAYALGITEVDSLFFDLDFRRFLRKDKASFPDIDLDFETSRRHEVIEYLCEKYKGHAARICSYGLYKVDNLVNDLAKVCGMTVLDDSGKEVPDKREISALKAFLNGCIDEKSEIDVERANNSPDGVYYNKRYDNIVRHFCKLYRKVRFIGAHAAGVAITGGNLLDYCALRTTKDGEVFCSYDLEDIEYLNVIKFDILGLKTMESIGDLRKETGVTVDLAKASEDPKIIGAFAQGSTDGIFQFEKATPRNILQEVHADCFDDVVATNAMNRPGPLSMKQPELYAQNKQNVELARESIWWEYAKESYGTIIYQEQILRICTGMAGMKWSDADKLMKLMKGQTFTESAQKEYRETKAYLKREFVTGAVENGFPREEAEQLFENMAVYTFNKGHATGYSLISVEEMFYKVYYPNEYWFSKLKYARNETERARFCSRAVKDGSIIFLPHVNYSKERTSLRRVDGENVIQDGLSDLKGVGGKAAAQIVAERRAHGVFRSFDDFYDRCKSRLVTSRVIDVLQEQGALEFRKSRYIRRVTKYNSALFSRS